MSPLGKALEDPSKESLRVSLRGVFKKSPENPSEVPYREIFKGDAEVIEKTVDGLAAILRGGNFNYIGGWLNSVALNRIVLDALNKEGIKGLNLPTGVRVRSTNKEMFWLNYSSTVQETAIGNLKPGEVFIEKLD